MRTTYMPIDGREFDVEITKVSNDGRLGLVITDRDGITLDIAKDRPLMAKIANRMRESHKEAIADAKRFLSGKTEESRLHNAIDALMNGEDIPRSFDDEDED